MVFIDLSKAFETIDHAILLKELENYGIKETNLAWFRSYLTNWKQYIQITNDSKSDLQNTTCGVPQGSIFRPLLFLVYVNDLPSSSEILNPINNREIKNFYFNLKFLGVILDEYPSWKEHLKYTENKIAKSIGLMVKAKPFLDKNSLLSLYFSYIHLYINFANLAWASTHKTNLKNIHSQQKHALRIAYNKDRNYHTKELFRSCNVLNVYKLNLLNTSILMQKIKTGTALAAFHTTFKMPSRSYSTRFSSVNYSN